MVVVNNSDAILVRVVSLMEHLRSTALDIQTSTAMAAISVLEPVLELAVPRALELGLELEVELEPALAQVCICSDSSLSRPLDPSSF